MTRAFSGIQPTGDLHLGNFLGAVRRWVTDQHEIDSVFCVVDLHALTIPQDPDALAARTVSLTQLLVACGLDPEVCTLFVQSHVAEHTGLAWLMECTASYGELSRMVQFKDKADRAGSSGDGFVSAGLFTYPALQAADILLYDTDVVPVGDDQRQHIELARDVANRFNSRCGADVLVVPEHVIPPVGARIMDLVRPADKMSKSLDSPQGTILVLDDPKVIEKKIKRGVTDTDDEVRFDMVNKPGVSNLLSILGAVTDRDPASLADDYSRYGPLKADTAEAVVEALRPVQARYGELAADPGAIEAILRAGATKARTVAAATLDRAHRAVGLLPPT
ncbi:MAG: tryptophan--tRNA ligase [Acidimicrobiales bacterium]